MSAEEQTGTGERTERGSGEDVSTARRSIHCYLSKQLSHGVTGHSAGRAANGNSRPTARGQSGTRDSEQSGT